MFIRWNHKNIVYFLLETIKWDKNDIQNSLKFEVNPAIKKILVQKLNERNKKLFCTCNKKAKN